MASTHAPDSASLARIGSAVRTRLASEPRVRKFAVDQAELYLVESFIPLEECGHLARLIDAVACPSRLVEEENWEGYRTSFSGDIDPDDAIVIALEARLAALTGLEPRRSECAQGQRYFAGQYYHEHCDWFDVSAPYWRREDRNGGQRSWTAMVYLNAVEKGGMTEFTKLGIGVSPCPGTLLLWNNALPDGSPNPWTIHAARPVELGEKYVVTKWYRARTWR